MPIALHEIQNFVHTKRKKISTQSNNHSHTHLIEKLSNCSNSFSLECFLALSASLLCYDLSVFGFWPNRILSFPLVRYPIVWMPIHLLYDDNGHLCTLFVEKEGFVTLLHSDRKNSIISILSKLWSKHMMVKSIRTRISNVGLSLEWIVSNP